MNRKSFGKTWVLILLGTLLAAVYPIRMGIRVSVRMAQSGYVPLEEYPKYVIPYTPIALALIAGVLLMPPFIKFCRKLPALWGSLISLTVFFVTERIMETRILVGTVETVPLESWQMSLCYIPPTQYRTRTWEAVDVLLGGYSPAFKLHFYLISVLIILSLLCCFYGFAKMAADGDIRKKKALTVQLICALAFLGMCIWACFTAFYREGELLVSPLSALLMAVFFILMGMTAGLFTASFTLGKGRGLSVILPAAVSALITLTMYIGEMILLSGNLYRFGEGFWFEALGPLVLAPADLAVLLVSAGITALICLRLQKKEETR